MASYGPYTPIVQAGNFYFISGQVGINPETKKAPLSIEDQAHQAMRNMQALLQGEGLDMGNLVRTTLYLARMRDFGTVNEVYQSYFDPDQPKPARECVGIDELPDVADKTLFIQISGIAYNG